MRVLIVSDTHGNDRNFERVLMRTYPVDRIFHLGDMEGSETYLEDISPCPIHMVRGNNDFFSPAPTEQVVEVEGHRVFMTHGHRYGVAFGLEKLKEAAKARQCDLVFYGHTHRPMIETEDGVTIINPGSLTYPRQKDRKASYIIMEINGNGETDFAIDYVE